MQYLRKMKCFFFITFAMLVSTVSFANESAPLAGQCIDGKLYVEPGTVHVAPNGIFFIEDGNFIPVEWVSIDEYGVYVLTYDCRRMVKCSDCGRVYNADVYSDRCPHTGMKVVR